MRGGAPALIASSRDSNAWFNDSMMKALFDALWPGVLPTYPCKSISYPVKHGRIGDIMNYAKACIPVLHSIADDQRIMNHFEMYHVIGDPSLEIWKAEPKNAEIKVWLDPQDKNMLNIEISDTPEGAVVTIWYDNFNDGKSELYKRIGRVYSPMVVSLKDKLRKNSHPDDSNPVAQRITVCFSAPGYRFRKAEVDIWTAGKKVEVIIPRYKKFEKSQTPEMRK